MARGRALLSAALAAVCLLASGCSALERNRDAYENGRTIDPDLAEAQDSFVTFMSMSDSNWIADNFAVPANRDEMRHVVEGYGGHPTKLVSRAPGEDATAEITVAVRCPSGVQRIGINWVWSDGDWRAWPDYESVSDGGTAVEYPGCEPR